MKPLPSTTRSATLLKKTVPHIPQVEISDLRLRSTIRESVDLLQRARSWCSMLEKAAPAEVAPIRKQSATFMVQEIKASSPKNRSPDNSKFDVATLRSDIESVRREIKQLGKKVSKKQVNFWFI